MSERCGHWMPRARACCNRIAGHNGPHRGPAGLAAQARYDNSEAGRESRRNAVTRYIHSEKGRTTRRAWRQSANGRAYSIRDAQRATESGRSAEAQARYKRRKAEERDNALLAALTRRS